VTLMKCERSGWPLPQAVALSNNDKGVASR
jgi:hypothetical protein